MSIQQQLHEPNYQLDGFSFYASTDDPIHYLEHRHEELEVALVLNDASAQVAWQTDKGQTQHRALQSDHLCVIPSLQPHTFGWDQPAEYILIFLHPTFLLKAAQELILVDSIKIEGQYAIANSLIRSLALTMRSSFQSEELTDHLYIDSLVNVLVMHLLKVYAGCQFSLPNGQINPPQRWLREVVDYIHNSLDEDLRLAKLASISNMSESSFCHLFKEYMGNSPHQYVIRQRVERARLLLRERKQSIAEIAYQCGFNSQSHLTIIFRQHMGMTPKAYRSSY